MPRSPMWTRRTRLLALAGGVAGAALALVARAVFFPGRPFDPQGWRAAGDADRYARHEMADRLVAERTLLGRTRDEVVGMLGEPLPPRAWDGPGELIYHLGPERGIFSIDSEWLSVEVGPDGRAVRAWIWRD